MSPIVTTLFPTTNGYVICLSQRENLELFCGDHYGSEEPLSPATQNAGAKLPMTTIRILPERTAL